MDGAIQHSVHGKVGGGGRDVRRSSMQRGMWRALCATEPPASRRQVPRPAPGLLGPTPGPLSVSVQLCSMGEPHSAGSFTDVAQMSPFLKQLALCSSHPAGGGAAGPRRRHDLASGNRGGRRRRRGRVAAPNDRLAQPSSHRLDVHDTDTVHNFALPTICITALEQTSACGTASDGALGAAAQRGRPGGNGHEAALPQRLEHCERFFWLLRSPAFEGSSEQQCRGPSLRLAAARRPVREPH